MLQYIVVEPTLLSHLALLSEVGFSLHYKPTVYVPYIHVIWLVNATPSHRISWLPRRQATHLSVNDVCVLRLENYNTSHCAPLVSRPRNTRRASATMRFANSTNRNSAKSNASINKMVCNNSRQWRAPVPLGQIPRPSSRLVIQNASSKTRGSTIPCIDAKVPGDLLKPNKSRSWHWFGHSSL